MATNTVATKQTHTAANNASGNTSGPYTISFDYLSESDVEVRVDNTLKTQTTHYTFPSKTSIQFTSGNFPALGATIEIKRNTDITVPKVDFQDGSVLTESDLDNNSKHLLFGMQETKEDTEGLVSTFVSASAPTGSSIVNGARWYDTVSGRTFIYYVDADTAQWVEANPPFDAAEAVQVASQINFLPSGTNAVTRTVDSKLEDVVSVKDFGAKGDGTTDDTAAFNTALALGKIIRVPASTYRISGTLSFPTGAGLVGDSQHTSILDIQGYAANISIFSLLGSNTIQSLRILGTHPNTGTFTLWFSFGVSCSNVIIRDNYVDAGVLNNSGTLNVSGHLFSIPSTGTQNNVLVENNTFTNFKFGILKTNTSTASNTNWKYINNTFDTFYAPALTFNTPSGPWKDSHVIGNRFINQNGIDVSSYEHVGGVAGSEQSSGFVFADNIITASTDGFHFEEGVHSVTISGNSINVERNALEFVDAYVGGKRLSPSGFTITGNTLVNTSGSPTGDGIQWAVDSQVTGTAQSGTATTMVLETGDAQPDNFYTGMVVRITGGTGAGDAKRTVTAYSNSSNQITVNSAFATTPDNTSQYIFENPPALERSIITANIIRNFNRGVLQGTVHERMSITDNYFDGCTIGLTGYTNTGGLNGNTFDACTTGINTLRGGLIGHSEFTDTCGTFISCDVGRTLCDDMTVKLEQFDIPAGTTAIPILKLDSNSRLDVMAAVHYFNSSTQFGAVFAHLTWDGTTLKATDRAQTMGTPNLNESIVAIGSGSTIIKVTSGVSLSGTPFSVSGGFLNIRLSVGGSSIIKNIRMAVSLKGAFITA